MGAGSARARLSAEEWERQSRSFDQVAEAYDAYRPGYPPALVDAVAAAVALRAESRILEIGSGTGKATEPFARLGCHILCVEPGKHLAAVAARKLSCFPRVQFAVMRFEEWPVCAGAFDLVLSAQAFHWVDTRVGLAKAAQALAPHGRLALFWNLYPGIEGPVRAGLEQAYQEIAPELTEPSGARAKMEGQVQHQRDWIASCGHFTRIESVRIPWSRSYSTDAYLGLLGTYSDHLSLPASRRARLFDAVAAVIEAHGGTIERPYVAVLHLAEKAQNVLASAGR